MGRQDDLNANFSRTYPFDAIRYSGEQGTEYWSARELARILGYKQYNKFVNAIDKAEEACRNSKELVKDHFTHTSEMVGIGSGAKRRFSTVHLSRYACYLVVQNADPEKPIVALAQAYFAVQTRRQELADNAEFAALPEDQKRLVMRSQMAILNQQLVSVAQVAGVIQPQDFAVFQNHGYRGLYGGETENTIHARKRLQAQEKILDYMGSDELAYNSFRASLAKQKIESERIQEKALANSAHFEVGQKVRQTIADLGGTMPEDLPTPEKSIQQLQREEQKRLQQGPQLSLFDDILPE